MPRVKLTHCKRGHERVPENIGTARQCKICADILSKTPQVKQKQADWCKLNKNRRSNNLKQWKTTHAERVKISNQIINRKKVDNLTDSYIASTLHINVNCLSPEVIQLKRVIMQFKREIKNVVNQ